MYYVSAQGVDERMINVHYYYLQYNYNVHLSYAHQRPERSYICIVSPWCLHRPGDHRLRGELSHPLERRGMPNSKHWLRHLSSDSYRNWLCHRSLELSFSLVLKWHRQIFDDELMLNVLRCRLTY